MGCFELEHTPFGGLFHTSPQWPERTRSRGEGWCQHLHEYHLFSFVIVQREMYIKGQVTWSINLKGLVIKSPINSLIAFKCHT